MSDASKANPLRQPWSEAVATFLTCLALGPPIGGLVVAFGMAFSSALGGPPMTPGNGLAEQFMSALFVGLFAVPFSYLVGGLQAAAAGLAFAVYGWMKGRPPLWVAVVIAVVVHASAYAAGFADESEVFVLFFMVHVIPVLVCWLIIRNYWRERRT